jgi:hypothetical protein
MLGCALYIGHVFSIENYGNLIGENKQCRMLVVNLMEEMCQRNRNNEKCMGNFKSKMFLKRLPHVGEDRQCRCGL